MPIIAKDGGDFTPHPEGQFRAVCVDVVDKGVVETTWGDKKRSTHKIRVVFQTEETLENGKPAMASRTFTLSLSDKSALRPFLESWRGKAFTPDELKGFDLEVLLGVNAVIQVVHKHENGKTYDNITSIMRPMKGMQQLAARDYVRVCDRTPATAASNGGPGMDDAPPLDDEPFDDPEMPF